MRCCFNLYPNVSRNYKRGYSQEVKYYKENIGNTLKIQNSKSMTVLDVETKKNEDNEEYTIVTVEVHII